ncbi:IS3 family transposase [Chitinophagales bacterium]|nr:IS3 family transposase [Chitinophagales bacterium]
MKAYYKRIGLGVLCGLVGKTRQAFYNRNKQEEKEKFAASIVIYLVLRERKIAKRIGGKRLLLILRAELLEHGISIGNQRFIDVLRANDLLVKRRKRKPKLTDSRHKLPVYPNKANNLYIWESEMLWFSDITYIKVFDQFCYLILITDAYSRKVVGYNFARRMTAAFCVEALRMAIENRKYPDRNLIHHSDRGSQYCSKEYTDVLQENNIMISMTENGDPLENPLAERMNRTFKDVFGLDENFPSFDKANIQTKLAVEYYNDRLPHSSINMLTPNQAHTKSGKLKKHWKWYWRENHQPHLEDNFYTPK